MPMHKRGSVSLEYEMSLGTDVRDEVAVAHNSFNSSTFVTHQQPAGSCAFLDLAAWGKTDIKQTLDYYIK